MDKFGDGAIAIIAGASGLVGQELTQLLLSSSAIQKVHALVRHPLDINSDKLNQIQDEQLRITRWDDKQQAPDLGFICLGTTMKQAGSKQALAHVDYELVCQVAQTMKFIGVKRIAVVSSYGARPNSLSHYLKCKGKMEKSILEMDFERVIYVRPGPLSGNRLVPRKDEQVIGTLLKIIKPLLIGPLGNFASINASDVAKAMLYSAFQPQRLPSDAYLTLTSTEMHALLRRFDQDMNH